MINVKKISIMAILLTMPLVITLFLYIKSYAQQTSGTLQSPPNLEQSFDITKHTSDGIEGIMRGGGNPEATFKAQTESPVLISVEVRFSDFVLNASAELEPDGQKKVVIIDGHGKTLTTENKKALIFLAGRVEQYLDPNIKQRQAHEDLLVRTVGLWAEAPAGYPLMRQEVRPKSK